MTNKATNVTLRTVANQAELYTFRSLIPGAYTLTVEFAVTETLQVSLEVEVQCRQASMRYSKTGSTETRINVSAEFIVDHKVLAAGSSIETRINFSAEVVPLATTANGTLGHVVERQCIEQIPLNGRDVQQLLRTVPGLDVATANRYVPGT